MPRQRAARVRPARPADRVGRVGASWSCDPDARRQGTGAPWSTRSWRRLPRLGCGPRPAAGRAGARGQRGLTAVRELHKMARPLTEPTSTRRPRPCRRGSPPAPSSRGATRRLAGDQRRRVRPPPRAGPADLADLQERMAQPWFDPAGFILVEADDVSRRGGRLPLDQGRPGPALVLDPAATAGEVYVVGVAPGIPGTGAGAAGHRPRAGAPGRAGTARGRPLRRRRQPRPRYAPTRGSDSAASWWT